MVIHPDPFTPGRRYRGCEPYAYQAMRLLAERGTMRQRDFMRAYWACGAKGNSYGNHFGRYTVRAASLTDLRVMPRIRMRPIVKTVVDGVVMLTWRWTIAQHDWRPTHVIAEDHYAA